MNPRAVVADALARAFLAGTWEPEAMARRGQRALDDRRRWLLHLARATRSAHPEPPLDAPRELAAFLEVCPPLPETLAKGVPTVRRWYTYAPAMGPARWPVRPLATLSDVHDFLGLDAGTLAWFADARGWERHVPDEPLRHYRYRWSPKASGGARLIEEPKTTLKHFQRRILRDILDAIPPHPAAHGFRRGHSVVTHAAHHAGQPAVLRFDLEAFFATVSAARVYGLFRTAGYPEPVAHCLTALVTNAVPGAVSQAAPDPLLRQRLATPHLPQGAPTSPALANLVAFTLDRRLHALAEASGSRYSRYADDLTFSGRGPAPRFETLVAAIVTDEGFRLNQAKTIRRRAAQRQLVTGLVVNAKPNVRRTEYDTLKAIVHNARRTGGQAQNRDHRPDFRAHLAGRVAWLAHVHPEHGDKLRTAFETVDWGDGPARDSTD